MSEASPKQIRPLTGIRGLAALYVVAYHVPFMPWSAHSEFLRHGYLAVDLFFVLSGFVMAMSYSQMFAGGFSPRHYATFLIRRLARIYPLYLLVTCTYGFAMLGGVIDAKGLHPVWWTLLTNVLMIQAWGLTADILNPLWSISAEWAVYLMFPILAAGLLFSRWRTMLALCVLAFAVLVGLALAPKSSPLDWRSGPLDISWVGSVLPVVRCVVEFSLGLASFRAAERADVRRVAGHAVFAPLAATAVIGLLMVPDSDVAVVAMLPCIITSVSFGRGPVQAFLGWRPVFIAGELSYAIYLLHSRLMKVWHPLATILARLVGMDVAWRVSFLVVLLACAWLAHNFVEKPSRRAVRRLEDFVGRGERNAARVSEVVGVEKLS